MKTRRALCAALLALTPLTAHAQTPPATAAAPVTLRLKYTPGEVLHYKMTMDIALTTAISGQAANAPVATPSVKTHREMDMVQTVQSISTTDGSATIAEHLGQMTTTIDGQPIPSMTASPDDFTITIAPTGKMLSIKMPPSAAASLPTVIDFSQIGGMGMTALPADPVRVGDTWSGEADLSPMLVQIGAAGMKTTVQSSLASLDTGAQPAATIRQTYTGTLASSTPLPNASPLPMTGQLTGSSQMKLDMTSGSMTSQDGTTTMNITTLVPTAPSSPTAPPQTIKMQIQMTTHLTRLN